MEPVALWGANGAIGKSIANALRAAGRPYRVVGRSRAALAATFGDDPLAEIAIWDPGDAASIRSAAAGAQTIVYLVGVPYDQFRLHPPLVRATLDGAIAAGVPQFLLIGTVYPYGRATADPVREDHPRNPCSFKGRMRLEQENAVLEADRERRIAAAVLRLPDFYGPGVDRSFINEIFTKGVAGKTATLIGPIDRPHEYVYTPDVGPVVVRLIDEPRAFGRVWHLAGAGVTTPVAMIERTERVVGHPIKRFVAGSAIRRAIGLFNGIIRETVEMDYLLTDPLFLDDTARHELLGPIHKTSYDDGVREIVGGSAAARGSVPAG